MASDWEIDRLEKYINFKNGKKRPSKKGVYPVYGGNGILDYANDYNAENCIIIGRVGAYCGCVYKTKEKCWISDNAICGINNNSSDLEYFYYLLSSLQLNTRSIGSGQPLMTQDILNNIEVKVPPLKTQQKIAKVLGTLDDKIELNNSINNNLEQQIFALFDNLFPNVRDGESTISDYFSPKRGKNLLSKNAILGDVPVVAGGLNPATYHNVANTNAPVITISASGANAGFVNLWHIPVWSSDSSFIDDTITGNIYFWYVMLKKRQQEIFDSQTGSAQPHIYPQHIEVMPVCDLDEQLIKSFDEKVKPLFKLVGENIKENDYLTQLRDTLLPKLMSGEIDVSGVNIEEKICTPSDDKLSFSEK